MAEQELRTMTGGQFAPDHLGPEAHADLLRRTEMNAERYLDVWEPGIFSVPEDRHLAIQFLSNWAPARVSRIAEALVGEYDRLVRDEDALQEYSDPRAGHRLRERRDALRQLVH
ncbi:MAG: hypothetical protein AB8I08_16415 [Sandaracinaceae bacterium]